MSEQLKRDTSVFAPGEVIHDGRRVALVLGPVEPYKLWTTDERGYTTGKYSERLSLPVLHLPPRTDGIPEGLDESTFDHYRRAKPLTAMRWPG